jgi:Transposase IS66 family
VLFILGLEESWNEPVRLRGTANRPRAVRGLAGNDLVAYRKDHAGPILAAFADWLAEQRPRVLPKSTIGEVVTYFMNQ